mmetsp:Transcript_61459/g.143071  ORF Transcript_61459/g.143071 Transcript_61459/m.143071 type:complete len:225 (+) Transcript_61459:96-770(+)
MMLLGRLCPALSCGALDCRRCGFRDDVGELDDTVLGFILAGSAAPAPRVLTRHELGESKAEEPPSPQAVKLQHFSRQELERAWAAQTLGHDKPHQGHDPAGCHPQEWESPCGMPREEEAETHSTGGSASPHPSCMTPEHSADDEQVEQAATIKGLVQKIYEASSPAKLHEVDFLFTKYQGLERELYVRICKKYGVQPDPAHLPPPEEESSAEQGVGMTASTAGK